MTLSQVDFKIDYGVIPLKVLFIIKSKFFFYTDICNLYRSIYSTLIWKIWFQYTYAKLVFLLVKVRCLAKLK